MQEFETSKYLTGILEKNGFKIERGVAGIPTAWVATWGSGKPVISLGSDIDGIPQANQKPGVGYRDAQSSASRPATARDTTRGQAVNIAAAIVVKEIMERERIPGTLVLWPGVAEEQIGDKAHLVRAGVFKDVDVTLFTHVGERPRRVVGTQGGGNALISADFKFRGQTAHSAGAPWRGKSALDAVMLMANAWEMKREHLELPQRSHYVIPDGGDQPNVVPQTASIWFYFRERDYERTMAMFEAAREDGAGRGDDDRHAGRHGDDHRLGVDRHFNKPIAETMFENIKTRRHAEVGRRRHRRWRRACRGNLAFGRTGSRPPSTQLDGPVNPSATRMGGGSDDIGDVSWNVPTVTLRFPSNIPGLPGHNWANAIAMATPIAHKGGVAGAKVQALTLLDILLTPKVVADAWDYFRNVQTKDTKYTTVPPAERQAGRSG